MSASIASGTYRPQSFGTAVASSFRHWARLIWRSLENLGRARARVHLLQTAAQYDAIEPERAQRLRSAAQALAATPR